MASADRIGPGCTDGGPGCCGSGPVVIDPPCADGVTSPDATYATHLTFFKPSPVPPFPEMDVTLFPDHDLTHVPPIYSWTSGILPFPPGSSGEGLYFSLTLACGATRPTAGLFSCEGPPESPLPCDDLGVDDGTATTDPDLGPVVIYDTGFVLSGFHGED